MPFREKKFKSPIFHKIIFTISLFILLFIGAISFRHVNNTSTSFKLLMHSYDVNLKLEHLFSYIKDSENSMRGYLISRDTIYLAPYRTATKNVNESFVVLKKLNEDNPKQLTNLAELFKIVNKRNEYISNYTASNQEVDINRNQNFKKNVQFY